MAATSDVLQEFVIGINYKIDEAKAARFNAALKAVADTLGQLEPKLDAVEKKMGNLGTRIGRGLEPDLRKYSENIDKVQKQNFNWGKGIDELKRGVVTFGTTIAVSLARTVQHYLELDIAAKRAGSSIADLAQAQAGAAGMGRNMAATLRETITHFGELMQGFGEPGEGIRAFMLTQPEDREEVKKNFGEALKGPEAEFYAWLTRMKKLSEAGQQFLVTMAAQWANVPLPALEVWIKDYDRLAANTKTAGEHQRDFWADAGGDRAKTARGNIDAFGRAVTGLSDAWEQIKQDLTDLKDSGLIAPIEMLTDALHGLDQALTSLGKAAQGHPLTKALVSMGLLGGGGLLGVGAIALLRRMIGTKQIADALKELEAGPGGLPKPAKPGLGSRLGSGLVGLGVVGGATALYQDVKRHMEETKSGAISSLLYELFLGGFDWSERRRAGAPGAGTEAQTPEGRPGAQTPEGRPGFQHGGIVPINAHPGEMVLPTALSNGLQALIAQHNPFGPAQDAWHSLVNWLEGTTIPKVLVANAEELAREQAEAQRRQEGQGGGAAAGGGEGAAGGGGGAEAAAGAGPSPATMGGPGGGGVAPSGLMSPGAPGASPQASMGERGRGPAGGAGGGARGGPAAPVAVPSIGQTGGRAAGVPAIKVGSDAHGTLDKQSVYQALVARFRNSKVLNGFVPQDGAQFGVTKGTPEEWARLALAVGIQESDGLQAAPHPELPGNAGPRGKTAGMFQFGADDLRRRGLPPGGVTDPNIQLEAMAREWEATIPKAQMINGPNNTGAARYFGSIRRPRETLQHMAVANQVATAALKAPPTAQRGALIPQLAGGAMPVLAHGGEMILPEALTRGLTQLINTRSPLGEVGGGANLGGQPLGTAGGGGDRNMTVNVTHNVTVNGGSTPHDTARQYVQAGRRLHGDMLRDLKQATLA